jgi:uncharacterized protein YbjT (DUF2867 family)
MDSRIALVFGSTGLVGNLLLEQLISSEFYSGIKKFVRDPTRISDPKVEEIIVDFSNTDLFSSSMIGDDLFICLGSTIKKAGSIANMEKIDRDLPIKIASIARASGIKRVAVVSSVGANPGSGNYYLRIKGEMEKEIMNLDFKQIVIARPSILLGERKEKRTGEMVGKFFMKAIKPLLTGKLRKYRAIHGRDVAKAMISALQKDTSKSIYESGELKVLADLYR